MQVILLNYTPKPIETLYVAYRTCYSHKTPQELWEEVSNNKVSREEMENFIEERILEGHLSILEQINFTFGIAGISRSLSHQLVRHRIGITYAQQSQRFVKYKKGELEFITPPSIKSNPLVNEKYRNLMEKIFEFYQEMVELGIPVEDARFVLPNATPTNITLTVNFRELIHISSLRLCTRAQWEIRTLTALMKDQINKIEPFLAKFLEPKCGKYQLGYCNERYEYYLQCPYSKLVPHKSSI